MAMGVPHFNAPAGGDNIRIKLCSPETREIVLPDANKMLSYRRETALQGTLVLAESGRLELRDNILQIL